MGSIYASAPNTIIYLGEFTEESDRVLQTLRTAGPTSPKLDLVALRNGIVSSILSRPWFTRVWVLQELALSRNPIIQCGQSRVRWGKLQTFFHAFTENLLEVEKVMLSMSKIRDEAQMDILKRSPSVSRDQALYDIVRSRSGQGATDPRDIIYAHIGMVNHKSGDRFMESSFPCHNNRTGTELQFVSDMAQPSEVAKFTADDERSEVETYNDFAAQIITDFPGSLMDMIAHAQQSYPGKRMPGLASWAPDWRIKSEPYISRIMRYLHFSSVTQYAKYGELHGKPVFAKKGETVVLGLIGESVGIIEKISDVINLQDPSFAQTVLLPTRLRPTAILDVDSNNSLYSQVYDRWRRAIGEDILPPFNQNDSNDHTHINRVRWAFGMGRNPGSEPMEHNLIAVLVRSSVFLGDTPVQGQRIAYLSSSMTALVPAAAQIGDEACCVSLDPRMIVFRSDESQGDESIDDKLRSEFAGVLEPNTRWLPDFFLKPIRHGTLVGDYLGAENASDYNALGWLNSDEQGVFALH